MTKTIIVGIDEAGRGCMAGHMFVSAVAMRVDQEIEGLKDSKKLTDAKRAELIPVLEKEVYWYKVLSVSPKAIDEEGLGRCWKNLVRELAHSAYCLPRAGKDIVLSKVILDGNCGVNLSYVIPVVKADSKYPCVMAASVFSKFSQTCYMDEHHRQFPEYGFDKHRGYVTKKHMEAVKEFGICPIHRQSYRPIKNLHK